MDSEVAGSCRESTLPRSDEHSTQKRMGSRRYEKLAKVTHHPNQYGFEISFFPEEWWISIVDCDLQRCEQIRWRTSWRKWRIYLLRSDWLPLRRKRLQQNRRDNEFHHYFRSQRCSCQWTNGSGRIFFPSTASTEISLSYRGSTTLTRIPRHRGFHREDDGAMDWDTLLHLPCRDNENAPRWTNSEWLDFLYRGSDKNKLHD